MQTRLFLKKILNRLIQVLKIQINSNKKHKKSQIMHKKIKLTYKKSKGLR